MTGSPENDLSKEQLRALAKIFCHFAGGADQFARGVLQARTLAGGALHGELLWRLIGEEMFLAETGRAQNRGAAG